MTGNPSPQIIANRYIIQERIGAGAMGTVYRAQDQLTGEIVAVKQLKPEAVASNPSLLLRFEREAEALRQLNHPNIVKVIERIEEHGQHYIVMEYVAGGSLRDLLDEHLQLSLAQILKIGIELADALTRTHYLRIIHRDIKPDNVLLDEDGTARLTDFGVAHLASRDSITETEASVGTLFYMCPESFDDGTIDARADIWSFGVMLFEMLAGQRPFGGSAVVQVVNSILHKPTPDIHELRPDAPEKLNRLIYQMLDKQPDTRIPSIRIVGAELEAIIETTEGTQDITTWWENTHEMARIHSRSIRLLLVTPDDVQYERNLALNVVDNLPYKPNLRGRISVETIAWHNIVETLPPGWEPGEAGDFPPPASYDIIIFVLWSKLIDQIGWIYDEARQHFEQTHTTPRLLIYRRDETPSASLSDSNLDEKVKEWQQVNDFVSSFHQSESVFRRSINTFKSPYEFRKQFERQLEAAILQVVREVPDTEKFQTQVGVHISSSEAVWEGSPFPGLRAFTPADHPIFFGRERETDELVQLVRTQRMVAVVGASGSGKSSLVGAGLIPRLQATSIKHTVWIKPGEGRDLNDHINPFAALYDGFTETFTELQPHDPDEVSHQRQSYIELLETEPAVLNKLYAAIQPHQADLLLVVDQFEEIFTLVAPTLRDAFIDLLIQASHDFKIILTMRMDFYHRCADYPELVELLNQAMYSLAAPRLWSLYDMIVRPAERAALHFEPGLAEKILEDTSSDPGSLALLAYALDELYRIAHQRGDNRLTFRDYDQLGYVDRHGNMISGVRGAIGKRSEIVFSELDEAAKKMLSIVFRELVEVDERGTATRRRALMSGLTADDASRRLVDTLTEARLLVKSVGKDGQPIVEVAHEALLTSWERLASWIEKTQEDLWLLRQVRQAAQDWDFNHRRADYYWSHERLQPVYEMQKRLQLAFDPVLTAFIRPEAERRLEELKSSSISERRQLFFVDRCAEIGELAAGALIQALQLNVSPNTERAIYHTLEQFHTQSKGTLHLVMRLMRHRQAGFRRIAAQLLYRFNDAGSLHVLVQSLKDDDKQVRLSVINTLGNIGDTHSIPYLVPHLDAPDTQVAVAAAEALGKIGSEKAIPHLSKAIERNLPSLQLECARTLGMIGGTQALAVLLRHLNTANASVRLQVIQSISSINRPQAVPRLLPALVDDDNHVRTQAKNAIIRIADYSSVPHLLNALAVPAYRTAVFSVMMLLEGDLAFHAWEQGIRHVSVTVRQDSARALGLMESPDALSPLIEALGDVDSSVQKIAVQALDKMHTAPILLERFDTTTLAHRMSIVRFAGRGDVTANLPVLLKALHTGDPSAKLAEEVLQNARISQPLLENALRHTDAGVQLGAVVALDGQSGSMAVITQLLNQDKDSALRVIGFLARYARQVWALQCLAQTVLSQDADIRVASLQAIQNQCRSSNQPMQILMQQGDVRLRRFAVQLMKEYAQGEDLEWMIHHLSDDDAFVRQGIRDILSELGQQTSQTVLIRVLDEAKDEYIFQFLAQANLFDGRVLPRLIKMSQDYDRREREKAAYLLGKFRSELALGVLDELLHDDVAMVRRAAIWSLSQFPRERVTPTMIIALLDVDMEVYNTAFEYFNLSSKEAVEFLSQYLTHPDELVRRASIATLGQIGDQTTLPLLERTMNDPDPKNKRYVYEAMRRIDEPFAKAAMDRYINKQDK